MLTHAQRIDIAVRDGAELKSVKQGQGCNTADFNNSKFNQSVSMSNDIIGDVMCSV